MYSNDNHLLNCLLFSSLVQDRDTIKVVNLHNFCPVRKLNIVLYNRQIGKLAFDVIWTPGHTKGKSAHNYSNYCSLCALCSMACIHDVI